MKKGFLILCALIAFRLYATDRFVVCSCMKSGTHYLRNILMEASGRQAKLHSAAATEEVFGILHTRPNVSNEVKVIYLYRDPRDVLVSYAQWAPNHAAWEQRTRGKNWFQHRLQEVCRMSMKERILYLLDLNNPQELVHSLPDIPDRLVEAKRKPDRSLVLRFEDLIGARGGGSQTRRHEALAALREFLHLDHLSVAQLEGIADRVWGHSPTYRSGPKVGKWRAYFDDEVKQRFFTSPYRNFLVLLGYEKDHQW